MELALSEGVIECSPPQERHGKAGRETKAHSTVNRVIDEIIEQGGIRTGWPA
jgi:hypothetical protein